MMPWEGKRAITVVTACMEASGLPTFVRNEVEVTFDEYENGLHYYFAEAKLQEHGYEEPYCHFDQWEAPAFLLAAVPPQVAASLTAADLLTENPVEAL